MGCSLVLQRSITSASIGSKLLVRCRVVQRQERVMFRTEKNWFQDVPGLRCRLRHVSSACPAGEPASSVNDLRYHAGRIGRSRDWPWGEGRLGTQNRETHWVPVANSPCAKNNVMKKVPLDCIKLFTLLRVVHRYRES